MRVFERECGLLPEEILMVGDTFSDIEFGINSGTHTLGVGKSEKNRNKLATLAEYVAHDVSEIFDILEKIENS
jgi:phosphoglycolate phosphatase-like HAD superfamily hydrolase